MASALIRAVRRVRPVRAARPSRSTGPSPRASKRPSSLAAKRCLLAMNPWAICMISAGVGVSCTTSEAGVSGGRHDHQVATSGPGLTIPRSWALCAEGSQIRGGPGRTGGAVRCWCGRNVDAADPERHRASRVRWTAPGSTSPPASPRHSRRRSRSTATACTRSIRGRSCSPAASTATSGARARGWRITSTSSRTSTSGRFSPTVAGSPVRPASTPTASSRAAPGSGHRRRTASATN